MKLRGLIILLSLMIVGCSNTEVSDLGSSDGGKDKNPPVDEKKSYCQPEITSPISYTIIENFLGGLSIRHCHENRSVTYCHFSGAGQKTYTRENRCRPKKRRAVDVSAVNNIDEKIRQCNSGKSTRVLYMLVEDYAEDLMIRKCHSNQERTMCTWDDGGFHMTKYKDKEACKTFEEIIQD